jgi:hypothetical protein
VAYLFRFQRYIPASLLFIQATQKDVHLMVKSPLWMVLQLLTLWTLTLSSCISQLFHRLILE